MSEAGVPPVPAAVDPADRLVLGRLHLAARGLYGRLSAGGADDALRGEVLSLVQGADACALILRTARQEALANAPAAVAKLQTTAELRLLEAGPAEIPPLKEELRQLARRRDLGLALAAKVTELEAQLGQTASELEALSAQVALTSLNDEGRRALERRRLALSMAQSAWTQVRRELGE